ncbi:MAG: hypothetical protein ABI873_00240 [Marmoricola sp.]
MNTTKASPGRRRNVSLGLAALAMTSVLLLAPQAQASHPQPGGDSTASAAGLDIGLIVAARKVAWAQDRVDRAWLYQY